jgi:hypothetical protein
MSFLQKRKEPRDLSRGSVSGVVCRVYALRTSRAPAPDQAKNPKKR